MIYIQEAHPSDLWQLESNEKDSVVYASPKGYEERVNLAGTCMTKLGVKFPALVDEFNNPTEVAYTGWPDRLYVVSRDGRIAHKSNAGPFGFEPAALEKSLEKIFAQ